MDTINEAFTAFVEDKLAKNFELNETAFAMEFYIKFIEPIEKSLS